MKIWQCGYWLSKVVKVFSKSSILGLENRELWPGRLFQRLKIFEGIGKLKR
jgi:hypothetical protein